MTREFIRTSEFDKCWTRLGLLEKDVVALETELCLNPHLGDVIVDTGGLRKLRWQTPGQGKRGGARIIYIDFFDYEKIYLISAYPKNKKANLSESEKKEVKKSVKILKEQL